MKVGLVASSGGHLTQLWWLEAWWSKEERFWVSFDTLDAQVRLSEEVTYWAHHPTNRSLTAMWNNFAVARRVLKKERPDVLVTSGAGVALPFFLWGWVLGIPLVYLEVYDRIDTPTLTWRLLRPFLSLTMLQWPDQLKFAPEGIVVGRVR